MGFFWLATKGKKVPEIDWHRSWIETETPGDPPQSTDQEAEAMANGAVWGSWKILEGAG
jgi:hypothetical protein